MIHAVPCSSRTISFGCPRGRKERLHFEFTRTFAFLFGEFVGAIKRPEIDMFNADCDKFIVILPRQTKHFIWIFIGTQLSQFIAFHIPHTDSEIIIITD
jgi:hypothetical protein